MRLCVYYSSASMGRSAHDYRGRVEWIVCKECQRAINSGRLQLPAVRVRLPATRALRGKV